MCTKFATTTSTPFNDGNKLEELNIISSCRLQFNKIVENQNAFHALNPYCRWQSKCTHSKRVEEFKTYSKHVHVTRHVFGATIIIVILDVFGMKFEQPK